MSNLAESESEPQALSLVFPPAVIERIAERVAELVAGAKPTQEREGYLNVGEALAFLAWGERGKSRLYNLTCSNAIPHYKVGGRLYFERDELAEWVAAGRRGA
jgi:hypothetical protein